MERSTLCLAIRTVAVILALSFAPANAPGNSEFYGSPPDGRAGHTAVWTGTEMIVWGGVPQVNSGGKYTPATDVWRPMAVANAPSPRQFQTAVWTGSEMIVWGGCCAPTDPAGGRYDPATDTWRPTSIINAPCERDGHVAIWTGSEMIVWGGECGLIVGDGGRYDPVRDSWRPTSGVGAASPRRYATAVWTGSEMVVWGGEGGTLLNDGARYDPVADSWRPMASSGAPQARSVHVAVWTGREMIVWGGFLSSALTNTGGRYDPSTDSWMPTSVAGAPAGRPNATAVWSGDELIVWGGYGSNTGGRYDPVRDVWTATPLTDAPAGRDGQSAVWTGGEMIVWGGEVYPGRVNTGGRYDPITDSWVPSSLGSSPSKRAGHAAVWTGSHMVIWGGDYCLQSGGIYDPTIDSWRFTREDALTPDTRGPVAFWTGREVFVWGSEGCGTSKSSGAAYDPAWNSWRAISPEPSLLDRQWWPTAVWTGTQMIVWGGLSKVNGDFVADGARYDLATDSWSPTSLLGAPSARNGHVAVWTGSEMIVWAGYDYSTGYLDTGGRYDPTGDTWSTLSPSGGTVEPRTDARVVFTGTEMCVWGGFGNSSGYLATGGLYDATADSWRAMSTAAAPSARWGPTMVWTGSKAIIWGGVVIGGTWTATGALYDPATDSWSPTSTGAYLPSPRASHSAIWTGSHMVVWGGSDRSRTLDTGGIYDPATDTWVGGGTTVSGLDVLAGKGHGPGGHYEPGVRGYRVEGVPTPTAFDAFPEYSSYGVRVGAGDVDGNGAVEALAAPGPRPQNAPRVRAFDRYGSRVSGVDFLAYAAPGYGASVGAGTIDSATEILTGPGPSPVYGPHVRAFHDAGGVVSPIAKVSFYAYGTLRYGANVALAELDGDGYDEILTAPGPGVPFAPHVRGFDYDGATLRALARVSFDAYATPRYGADVGAGDVDGDGYSEILPGPGPSAAFAPQLRAFDYDGASVAAIARVNTFVWSSARYGLDVAAGDLDSDGFSEIVCGPGPDPQFGSRLAAFDFDGARLAPIASMSVDVYGLSYGLRVATADLRY